MTAVKIVCWVLGDKELQYMADTYSQAPASRRRCGVVTPVAAADTICGLYPGKDGMLCSWCWGWEELMIGACRPSLCLSVLRGSPSPSSRVSYYGPRKQQLGINYTAPAAAVSAAWMTHCGSELTPRNANEIRLTSSPNVQPQDLHARIGC